MTIDDGDVGLKAIRFRAGKGMAGREPPALIIETVVSDSLAEGGGAAAFRSDRAIGLIETGSWPVARPPKNPDPLRGLPLDQLRRAIEIYLAGRLSRPRSRPRPSAAVSNGTPGLDASELLGRPPFEKVSKPAGESTNLRPPAGQRPIPPHEDAGPALGRPGRLPPLRQHPRPRPRASTPPPPTPTPSWPSRPRTRGSRSTSNRPGTRPACPTFPRYLKRLPRRPGRQAPARRAGNALGRKLFVGSASSRRRAPSGILRTVGSPSARRHPTFSQLALAALLPAWWRGRVKEKQEPQPGGGVDVDGAAVELDERLDQAEAEAHPLACSTGSRPRSGASCRGR